MECIKAIKYMSRAGEGERGAREPRNKEFRRLFLRRLCKRVFHSRHLRHIRKKSTLPCLRDISGYVLVWEGPLCRRELVLVVVPYRSEKHKIDKTEKSLLFEEYSGWKELTVLFLEVGRKQKKY